jgi:hypothetical protein
LKGTTYTDLSFSPGVVGAVALESEDGFAAGLAADPFLAVDGDLDDEPAGDFWAPLELEPCPD